MACSASILIIDDDAAVSRTLSLILTRAGYQVNTVTSGRKGLELLSNDGYDLVLTDNTMPRVTGLGRRPDRQG